MFVNLHLDVLLQWSNIDRYSKRTDMHKAENKHNSKETEETLKPKKLVVA
jgi:hypothetical protein